MKEVWKSSRLGCSPIRHKDEMHRSASLMHPKSKQKTRTARHPVQPSRVAHNKTEKARERKTKPIYKHSF